MKVSVNQELRKAKSLTKKGELNKAREIYQRILESFPSNKQAIEGLTNLGNPAVHASLHPPKETMDHLISFYNQGLYDAAREVAALSGRTLKYPESAPVKTSGSVGDLLSLENERDRSIYVNARPRSTAAEARAARCGFGAAGVGKEAQRAVLAQQQHHLLSIRNSSHCSIQAWASLKALGGCLLFTS